MIQQQLLVKGSIPPIFENLILEQVLQQQLLVEGGIPPIVKGGIPPIFVRTRRKGGPV